MKHFIHWSKRCVVVCVLLVFSIFLGGKAYAIEILMGNEGMLVFEPCEVTINVGDTVTFKKQRTTSTQYDGSRSSRVLTF